MTTSQPNPFLSTRDWYDSRVGRYQYDFIKQVLDAYQPDVIVCTQLVMPAFVLAEIVKIPLIVIGYCEYLFPGIDDTCSSKQWRIESLTQHYNNLRENLGLPLVTADPATTPLIGDKYLLRSIPQLTTETNLPSQVELVGGLIFEPPYVNVDMDNFIATSQENNRPLYYVQIGRLFNDRHLWDKLICILGNLPVNFILDLSRSDYVNEHIEFPDNFYLHPLVTIAYIKDAVLGVICSGQTTSVLSAIYHGKPVLGIPNSADGAEGTDRIVKHGIGAGIFSTDDMREDVFMYFFSEVERGIFEDKLHYFQTHLLSYEDDDQLLQRSFT
ncbi:glycosyltransferase [Undibacterium sp. Di26W]|uniref:glycosyltransferase n=1 Tax=Undibacterium sp. Di26W TaxID=3413035 RepID=UPI003BF0E826